jgi:hypothetical protein
VRSTLPPAHYGSILAVHALHAQSCTQQNGLYIFPLFTQRSLVVVTINRSHANRSARVYAVRKYYNTYEYVQTRSYRFHVQLLPKLHMIIVFSPFCARACTENTTRYSKPFTQCHKTKFYIVYCTRSKLG